jgi:predicted DCC family thiol-disulfide oxidoreductase YuxK
MSTRTHRLTVLFDADCGLCSACAARLRCLDRSRRLRLIPLQEASMAGDVTASLAARVDLSAALTVVDAGGQVTAGGEAMLRIAEHLPGLAWLAWLGRRRLVRPFVEPVYALVARHRTRIGRLLGTVACRLPPRAP